MNSKPHALCDGQGHPVVIMLAAGRMNARKGADILAPLLPKARGPVADRGCDSTPFRAALAERGIVACIPPGKNRKQPIPCDKALCRRRHRIESAIVPLWLGP